MIVERSETEELKKRAAILQEREKRMIAEERRAHKAKARTADAWQSVAKAKAYHERVSLAKSQEGQAQEKETTASEPQPKKSVSRKKGSLLDRIMGD